MAKKFYIYWEDTRTGEYGVVHAERGFRTFKTRRAAEKAIASFQGNAPDWIEYSVVDQLY